jgi:uncharacterized membrane protein
VAVSATFLSVSDVKHSVSLVDGPGLERTSALTDAVVAIAMTLLVLPLVEVAGEVDTDHPRSFVAEHSDLLLSFVVSFLVIYIFWSAHRAALAVLHALGHGVGAGAVRQFNMWWLLVIAFLPFPTAVVGRDLNTTSAPLYIGTMFGLCALLALVNADLGMYGLLLLLVVRLVEARFLEPARSAR